MMFLLSAPEIQACIRENAGQLPVASTQYRTVISIYGSSHTAAISVARVTQNEFIGEHSRHVEVFDIPLFMTTDDLRLLTETIFKLYGSYEKPLVLLDNDGGMGFAVGYYLAREKIPYKSVKWGEYCQEFNNCQRYRNKRTQANVCMARAIKDNRFLVVGEAAKHRNIIELQGRYIPYRFDHQGKYELMTADEMSRAGINEPHVWNSLAFMFLEKIL